MAKIASDASKEVIARTSTVPKGMKPLPSPQLLWPFRPLQGNSSRPVEANRQHLRQLPKIDELVAQAQTLGLDVPRWALLKSARRLVEQARARILDGGEAGVSLEEVGRLAQDLVRPSLVGVINATGVILHTNLGRAPLADEALASLEVARGYCNLEYDLGRGRRGSRHSHAAELVSDVCGAEDACVVNNNAGAVLLALAALATDREVVVSRGELIEIGGSFRIPDVMDLSRARLVEVGTTNKTHLADYENAIREETSLLLKVHRANFAIVGFSKEVSIAELAALGRERGVNTMMDLGSGSLLSQGELDRLGLPSEPAVASTLSAGIDLVTFSGDKLLGGPQAGVIAGRRELIAKVRSHPFMRALRPDKLTIAGLCATLELYRDGREERIPTVAMLRAKPADLRSKAERLQAKVGARAGLEVERIECQSTAGGGSEPTSALPSWGLAIAGPRGADAMATKLRARKRSVVVRIHDDRLMVDVRCVDERDLDELAAALAELADTP